MDIDSKLLAKFITCALRDEGFDAFNRGYYNISTEAFPIIKKAIDEYLNKLGQENIKRIEDENVRIQKQQDEFRLGRLQY